MSLSLIYAIFLRYFTILTLFALLNSRSLSSLALNGRMGHWSWCARRWITAHLCVWEIPKVDREICFSIHISYLIKRNRQKLQAECANSNFSIQNNRRLKMVIFTAWIQLSKVQNFVFRTGSFWPIQNSENSLIKPFCFDFPWPLSHSSQISLDGLPLITDSLHGSLGQPVLIICSRDQSALFPPTNPNPVNSRFVIILGQEKKYDEETHLDPWNSVI